MGQARQAVSSDSALAAIAAEAVDGTVIDLIPKFDPKIFTYRNKILLPGETNKVKLTAQARDIGSQIFIHCLDPRQDKRAVSFVGMLAPKRESSVSFKPDKPDDAAAVRLQAVLRGHRSRQTFKELLRESKSDVNVFTSRSAFVARAWANAKAKALQHLKVIKAVPAGHFSASEVTARAIKNAIKFNMTNTAYFFASLDKDRSGDISTSEFIAGLCELGLPAFSEDEMALLWTALGVKNGRFTYSNLRHFLGEHAVRQYRVRATVVLSPDQLVLVNTTGRKASPGRKSSVISTSRSNADSPGQTASVSPPGRQTSRYGLFPLRSSEDATKSNARARADYRQKEQTSCFRVVVVAEDRSVSTYVILIQTEPPPNVPAIPKALEPLFEHLSDYYSDGVMDDTGGPSISKERFVACCKTLQIANPDVARAAFDQISLMPNHPIPTHRVWHCIWFSFVRMLSDYPLIERYSHEWKYSNEMIMDAVTECLHPLKYNMESATLVTSNRSVWREKARLRRALEESASAPSPAELPAPPVESTRSTAQPVNGGEHARSEPTGSLARLTDHQLCSPPSVASSSMVASALRADISAAPTQPSPARSPKHQSNVGCTPMEQPATSDPQSAALHQSASAPLLRGTEMLTPSETLGKFKPRFQQQNGCQLWQASEDGAERRRRVDGSRLAASSSSSRRVGAEDAQVPYVNDSASTKALAQSGGDIMTPQWLCPIPSRCSGSVKSNQNSGMPQAAVHEVSMSQTDGVAIDEAAPVSSSGWQSVGAMMLDYETSADNARDAIPQKQAPLRVLRRHVDTSLHRQVGVALARNYRTGCTCDRDPTDGGLARPSSFSALPRHRAAPPTHARMEPNTPCPGLSRRGPSANAADPRGVKSMAYSYSSPNYLDEYAARAMAAFPANQKPTPPTMIHAAPTYRKPPDPPLPPPAACHGSAVHTYVKCMRKTWGLLAAMDTPGAATVPGNDPWGPTGIWGSNGQKSMSNSPSAVMLATRMQQVTCHIPHPTPAGERPKALPRQSTRKKATPKGRRSVKNTKGMRP